MAVLAMFCCATSLRIASSNGMSMGLIHSTHAKPACKSASPSLILPDNNATGTLSACSKTPIGNLPISV